jgi:aminopeptidase N/puromycin-sensitive aminopeptidase
VGDYMSLVLAMRRDPNAEVVRNAVGKLSTIAGRIAMDADRERLKTVVRKNFGPVYASLGAPSASDSYDRRELRSTMLALLGGAEDPVALADARRLTEQRFTQGRGNDPALTNVAIEVTAEHGDAAFYDRMMAMSKDDHDPVLRADSLFTLPRFTDPALVTRTLDYAASGQVRNQDSWVLFAQLIGQRDTRDQAWRYVRANWDKVRAQLTASSGPGLVSATGAFCTDSQAEEVKSFFATHKVEGSERTLSKALDSIHACVQRRAEQGPKLTAWLDSQ